MILIQLSSFSGCRKSSLSGFAPLEAVLFDVDGTLCDSDPLHYFTFREMLQEVICLMNRVVVSDK
jgi:hypothetical protein